MNEKPTQASVDCCVTSPPYWGLRDYGAAGQIGLEPTPDEYVAEVVNVLDQVRRVLRDDGTLWLNLGDSYAAANGQALRGGPPSASSTLEGNGHRGGGPKLHAIAPVRAPRGHQSFRRDREPVGGTRHRAAPALKPKDLVGIPWRVAFALQAAGWWLRQDIIWSKPNAMPESVRDRCTKAHEYLFLLSKSERYHFAADAIAEPSTNRAPGNLDTNAYAVADQQRGRTRANLHAIEARPTRNARSVWTITTEPFPGSHFAVMPFALAERCVLAGSRGGGVRSRPVRRRRHGRACSAEARPLVRRLRDQPRVRRDGARSDRGRGADVQPRRRRVHPMTPACQHIDGCANTRACEATGRCLWPPKEEESAK